MHPNSLANLRPVKKGEVRNIEGKARGKDYWRYVSKLQAPETLLAPMQKMFHIPRKSMTVESAVIMRLALEACRGDMKAIELWIERKYGKVTIPVDIATETGPLVCILNAPRNDAGGKVIDITPTQEPQDPEE